MGSKSLSASFGGKAAKGIPRLPTMGITYIANAFFNIYMYVGMHHMHVMIDPCMLIEAQAMLLTTYGCKQVIEKT